MQVYFELLLRSHSMNGIILAVAVGELPYAFSRFEAIAKLAVIVLINMVCPSTDSPFDCDSMSCLIANAFMRQHFGHFSPQFTR